MRNEMISVIVPIYNVASYLPRCIESLLDQTYDNIEIVLVDDCSTDESAVIAKEYAQKHPKKCRFIQREKNGGLSAARNTGLEFAAGNWISFVDSDDWVSPDYLSILYDSSEVGTEIIANTVWVLAYSDGTEKIQDECNFVNTSSPKSDKVAYLPVAACMKLYKRDCFSVIRFPEDIFRSEDIGTIVPIISRCDKISVVHYPIYFYFQREGSLSNSNYKNADISFYPRTINRMIELSENGLEKELEYRAVSELMYGMVMVMVRSHYPRSEICQHIRTFNEWFPCWQENPYISKLPLAKRIFIKFVQMRCVSAVKLLILLWDIKCALKK